MRQLAYGVHLTRDANKDAAKSILGLLNRKPTPATATQTLLEFRSFLASKGIISDTVTDAENVAMSNEYRLLLNQRQFVNFVFNSLLIVFLIYSILSIRIFMFLFNINKLYNNDFKLNHRTIKIKVVIQLHNKMNNIP